MKNLVKLLPLVLLLTTASCASVKVVTDLDKTVDFSGYETYSFLGWQDDSHQMLNEFDQKRIRDAFKSELSARGLNHVEEGGDMEISLFLILDQKTSISSYTDHYGSRGYGYHRYGLWGVGHSSTTYHEYNYTAGTLVMDVFDPASKNQIWQAIAKGTVNENPETRDKSIPKAVQSLMKDFPVQVPG